LRVPEGWTRLHPIQIQAIADSVAQRTGLSTIYLSRMGLDGSSGEHALRLTPLEMEVTNGAVTEIAARHQLQTLHVIGWSGGARVALGLMSRRQDLGCVVLGAASLLTEGELARNSSLLANPSLKRFDPELAIDRIAANRSERVILVADPRETITPFSRHEKFVAAMLKRGRRVELIKAQAADPPYHDVRSTFFDQAYECVSQRPAP
jgi:hypothetical protein